MNQPLPAIEPTKTFDPAAIEQIVNHEWLSRGCFTADPGAPGEPYTIVMPPPNVTGALHLGHAINNTLQDILIRSHRMRGFNVLWVPGLDHAGIATQAVVEKQLKENENKTRHDVGREGLVERIWAWKQQYGDRILEQLKRLGCSCDWTRTRFTLDESCAKAVRETFFKLFKDGLIYRGKRLVNWDVHLQTSISDDEIYHEAVKTSLWHIAYPIVNGTTPSPGTPAFGSEAQARRGEGRGEGTPDEPPISHSNPHPIPPPDYQGRGQEDASISPSSGTPGEGRGGGRHALEDAFQFNPHPNPPPDYRERGMDRPTQMVVATTRPETLLGDTAVAVHSQDPRWNWAIGLSVKLPLTNRLIPIIADDILVDPKFGSGVVKVTPAHDFNDYAVWQRHQGKPDQIDLINILNPDGTLNENAGKYKGLKRDAARKQVVADLGELLVKEEPYETQVGHSDRSKTAVEPYLSDQWFVKMESLAEPALEAVKNGSIKFHPERYAQQYLAWLGEKRDWPISRQLWWGHRIPIWSKPTTKRGPMPGTQGLMTTAEKAEMAAEAAAEHAADPDWRQFDLKRRRWRDEGRVVFLQHFEDDADDDDYPIDNFFCVRAFDDCEIIDAIEKRGWKQDPDVLDTWFSSALWPHSTLGWPDPTPELAKYYPTNVLLTGRDIISLWVARMVMTGMYNQPNSEFRIQNSESSSIPFRDVVINPTILDGRGERMSKSKGNGVDPVDIIDTQGADALRFTLTTMATETQDARLPVKKDAQGRNTSDKFDLGSKFANKIWQVSQFFILSNLAKTAVEPVDETKWSLADQWIISRFNRAVEASDLALSTFRFDQYARGVYDFFWEDFCNWYVEAAKPQLRDPARAGQTCNILAAVLDGALRLMHPVIPFITEAIWWRLNQTRASRSLPGWIDCTPSDMLISAAWPKVGRFSEAGEHVFPRLQEMITAIRNVRNVYKVDPRTPVTVSIRPPGEEAAQRVEENRQMIETLAICAIKRIDAELQPIPGAVRETVGGKCDLYLEGLVDEAAETQRVAVRVQELTKLISAMEGRLANAGYIAKAPPALVEQTQKQLADAKAELEKLRG